MTILYATYQTTLDSYNLSYWYTNLDFDEFRNDTNELGFEDSYFLYAGSDALALYGTGFEYWNTDMYFGTIQALSQWAWVPDPSDLVNGGYWEEGWHWTGWNLDMSLFFNTADTPELEDDLDLIKDVMSGADTVYLSDFNDSFRGFGGSDSMYGGAGYDTIAGDNGNDFVFGGDNGDLLRGGRGNDTVSGGAGLDELYGGAGNDTVKGGIHADTLYGGNGDDSLAGGSYADMLYGENGDDILDGGNGEDTLRGGSGKDDLWGGARVDTFVFVSGDNRDIIHDFDAKGAVHDFIDVSGLAAVSDWDDLVAIMNVKTDRVVFNAGPEGKIILLSDNVADLVADLDAGDFIF